MSRYTKVIRSLGHRRWFAALGRRAVPLDRWLQQRTGGRLTVIGRHGLPSLVLTTTGRRSGLPRTVPLLYAPDGDRFIVTASNWGQRHHPAWSGNLLATPRATVAVRDRSVDVVARLVEGAERAELWAKVLEVWPAYDTYTARSGRDIRVFLLEPVS